MEACIAHDVFRDHWKKTIAKKKKIRWPNFSKDPPNLREDVTSTAGSEAMGSLELTQYFKNDKNFKDKH